jgi:Ca-activated chloride channel family protein
MSFAAPWYLLGLLAVPLALAGYLLLQRRRSRYAVRFTNLDLLANVVERSPAWRRHVPAVLALLALTALLTGIARPQATVSVPRERATVVLTLDVSGSMTATDVEPTRMTAAKQAANDFLDEVPDGLQVGVVAFATGADVVAAPTDDGGAAREAVDTLQPGGGTALGEAIARSVDVAGTEPDAPAAILLLSDGANTQGTLDPLEAAERARTAGIPVYTVALGTPEGTVTIVDDLGVEQTIPVPPDTETLARVADTTGGQAFTAITEGDLRAIYEDLGSRLGSEQEERDVAHLFAGAGAALLLVGASLSALWFNRIP